MRNRVAVAVLTSSTMVWAQGVWEARAPYPIEATEVSAAAIGGRVYAVCGLTANGSVSRLFAYNPRTDVWVEQAPAPIPGGADHCNVAAAGGKLYLLGAIRIGSNFVEGNTYEYDPAADRWEAVGRMPTPRGASGVAAIDSKIYVAGGLAIDRSVATFEVFDTETRNWTGLPDMPTARDHLTAQAAAGRFYAISGRVGDVLAANEEYDPERNAWRARARIPTPRGGLASGVIGGRIVVFGGEGPSGTPEGTYRQNEEYDPATDTWRSLAPMPTPRHGLYGASLGGRIFTPSGGPRAGAVYSSAHEAFYLPPAEPPRIDRALDGAGYRAALAPGSLASLFGARLSSGEQVSLPFRRQMNAVTVRLNGTPVPLVYVGPEQVNFQLPYDLAPGAASLTVTNAGSESARFDLGTLAAAAPGIFTLAQTGDGQGAVLIAGTGLVARATRDAFSRPARRGEAVEIYCTGLGALAGPAPSGETTPLSPLIETRERPVVTIGGERAEVLFAGLAPGQPAGVYQVNARVPASAAVGIAVPVTVEAAGRASNTVTIAVQE